MRDESAAVLPADEMQQIRPNFDIQAGLRRARAALIQAGFRSGDHEPTHGDPEVRAIDAALSLLGSSDLLHLRSFIAKLNRPENARKFWTELMTPMERVAVDSACDGLPTTQTAGFPPLPHIGTDDAPEGDREFEEF